MKSFIKVVATAGWPPPHLLSYVSNILCPYSGLEKQLSGLLCEDYSMWNRFGLVFCGLMSLAWGYAWFEIDGTPEMGIGFLISVIGMCAFGSREA